MTGGGETGETTGVSATEATVAEVGPTPTDARAAFGLPRGASVGRYTVLGEVGRGAMGAVYAAYDPELDRRIALKLLHGDRGHEKAQRLVREARALASFSHRNVVAVHDVGVHHGRGFIATEFIDGITLREWLDAETRSLDAVLGVMRQAGEGLAAAHRAGIVHRDFKPANVMVDREGRVVVMDFGLARKKGEGRLASQETTESSVEDSVEAEGLLSSSTPAPIDMSPSVDLGLTSTGAVMGTPAYMSLEQHRGQAATAASDQFSFCVTLFEALTGKRPFDAPRRMAIAFAIKKGKREPWPSTPVPGRVRRAVERGLSAAPEDRWPDMGALLEQLERPARKRPWVLGATALAAALGTAGAIWWTGADDGPRCESAGEDGLAAVWNESRAQDIARAFEGTGLPYAEATSQRTVDTLDRFAARWRAGRRATCEAHAQTRLQSDAVHEARVRCYERGLQALDAMAEVFASADASMVRRAGDAVQGLPRLDRCDDVDALLSDTPVPTDPRGAELVAEARRMLVSVQAARLAGDVKAASALLERIEDDAGTVDGGFPPLLAEIELEEGLIAQDASSFERAGNALEHAYVTARRSNHDAVALEAATRLIYVVGYRLADYPRAELWAKLARAEADRVAPRSRQHARILSSAGILHGRQGRFDEARAHYLEAKAMYEALGETDNSDYEANFTNLGLVSINLGDAAKAHEYLTTAHDYVERRYGSEHPVTAKSQANLASASMLTGDLDAALVHAQRSLARARASHESGHVAIGMAQELVARVALAAGDLDGAAEAIEISLEISKDKLGPDHPATAERRAKRAEIALLRGDTAAARDDAQQAREILEGRFGPADPRTGEAASILAAIALARSDHDQARRLAEGVLASLPSDLAAARIPRARALLVLAKLASSPASDAAPEATTSALEAEARALIERSGAMGRHLR